MELNNQLLGSVLGIQVLDPHKKNEFLNYFPCFLWLIFRLKLDESFMDKGIFYNCSIFNSSNLVFESEDPHIFEDPDPRSQNVADPTVPDPKY